MRSVALALLLWVVLPLAARAQIAAGPRLCDADGNGTDGCVSLSVLGATKNQEELLRSELATAEPKVLPSRVVFLPHWKYIYTAKAFHLRVPTGMGSVMFTHLASRTVFIDKDHILSDEALTYWMAHELGHLATNSVREDDAERAAKPYRARLRGAKRQAR